MIRVVVNDSSLAAKMERLQARLQSPDPAVRRAAEKTALFAVRYGKSREQILDMTGQVR